MSQETIGAEKNCLNCNAVLQGKFCHECGQQNLHKQHGFWGIVKHFIYDIFHFDGKFFKTLRLLLVKPGKVARDYVEGKRVRYLDPIRMYLFISAITFFLFIFFANFQESIENIHFIATPSERLKETSRNYKLLRAGKDSALAARSINLLLDTTVRLRLKPFDDTSSESIPFQIDEKTYNATPVHDSLLFPERNWYESRLSRNLKKKLLKEGENFNKLMLNQNNMIFNMMPYMLFLSLPVFSFILKLLYRNKDNLHFSGHAVFTLYHYIVAFFILLAVVLLSPVLKYLGISNLNVIYIPAATILFIYLFAGLQCFYRESARSTIIKFLLVTIVSIISFILLGFLLTSITLLY